MVPPIEEKSKLAKQIREILRRFSWIGPLIEEQEKSRNLFDEPLVKTESILSSGNDSNYPIDHLNSFGVASRKIPSHHKTRPVSDPSEFYVPPENTLKSTTIDSTLELELEKYRRKTFEANSSITYSRKISITWKQLILIIVLILTLITVINMSLNLDEDLTVPIHFHNQTH